MSSASRTIPRDRPRRTGRAAALLVAMGVLTLLMLVPARQYLDQRARLAELERRAAALEARNDRLRAEIARLHDPVELERLARACLGMVRPGEIALVVPDAPRPEMC
ncbi:Cell division protein FtsL [bacterium HR12]|nr:Cell division protein FtsL [bacterium HR12]